jgi:hypothetical protein
LKFNKEGKSHFPFLEAMVQRGRASVKENGKMNKTT